MKNYNLIILSLVLFLTQTVSLKAQTNLLTNGGFEDVGSDGKHGNAHRCGNNRHHRLTGGQ
jgi:hypothetical protein